MEIDRLMDRYCPNDEAQPERSWADEREDVIADLRRAANETEKGSIGHAALCGWIDRFDTGGHVGAAERARKKDPDV